VAHTAQDRTEISLTGPSPAHRERVGASPIELSAVLSRSCQEFMNSAPGTDEAAVRWLMLAIISLGIAALTLNWFDVATAFPLIGAEFKVGLGSLSYLISLFIVGYGLAHLPGGVLAATLGMKKTLVLGLLAQGLAGVMSGLSHSYTELAFFRVVSGVGGSLFATVTFAAVVAWFRGKDVTLALGISGGAAFSAGAAFALYVWVYVQRATSWHTSLILAGIFELLVMLVTLAFFQIPDGARRPRVVKVHRAAVRASLANRDLWVYGIALLGGYGAYFTTSQLFSGYVTLKHHFDPSTAGLLSASIALAGIPGGLLGGYLADRSNNLRLFIVGSLVAVAGLLALIPVAPRGALWALGIGVGFCTLFGFAAWSAVPERVCRIDRDHIGTATGLMLTLAAVGGFLVPIAFGHLVPQTSFDTGWLFLAAVSVGFAFVGLAGRNPPKATARVPGELLEASEVVIADLR
jgi:ACS family D-galactonate transporter-like MFS transporter